MIFTNTPASRALAHCVMPLAPVYRGGDSEANTTNKTEVRDMRVVGGEASTNVSANAGGDVNVIATDHGAVAGGLQLGGQAIDAVVKNAQGVQDTTASMYAGALKTLDASGARMADAYATSGAQEASITSKAMSAVADAYQSSGSQLADAYSSVASNLATAFTDSKAPDKSLLQVAGVIVVGLAAVMVFGKKV